MFTHLHLHTEYSLLDGANRIAPLLDHVSALGMDACAITDHGVLYGVVDFYKAAKARGIRPVIGCEMYVCANMDDKSGGMRENSHLVLLCENQTGYHNLMKLVSEGFTRGFYYRPRVDYALLERYHEGLIALSACLSGDLARLLVDGREKDARDMARRYLSIFGPDHFYVELMDHGIPEERTVRPRLISLARELNIPLVATNDAHYLTREDAQAQEVLMCIQTGKTLNDTQRMRMDTDQLYVKSEEEMRALFQDVPEAIDNTHRIAMRCEVEFDFKSLHLPQYSMDEGIDHYDYLESLCQAGLKARYAADDRVAQERLQSELSVIKSMGYVDYFLIVWDFIHYAREQGILVGPGRGSGAGSIVAYCLEITGIDPIRYNLIFERFLNPERVSMPDLDIDFDYERRAEVIEYVARKYGEDHVAQIITFGTMAARAVLRDVGRVLDMAYAEVDQVAKMVPMQLNMTLEKAMSLSPELASAYAADERVRTLLSTARKLEGMPRHASTHAAGVLITHKPVSDYVPLQVNDEVVTTQFAMNTLESLGLLKMDFLGLRTLNVIGDTLTLLREGGGPDMRQGDIPLNDLAVYHMISQGDTDGVFQLEGGGMRSFLSGMKPGSFEDIIAAISLYRPGPMESIPKYIQGKQNPETVTYMHPLLEPILSVTYGCMVYQEQVMQIVRDVAGYSLGRSDLVRSAMSKKKHDVMAKEKEYFIHGKLNDKGELEIPGAVRRGVPEAVAERIFEAMSAFASYAFNKSHAAAYGVLAVQTGYLKLHHPMEFMTALMNSILGNTDKVAYYIQYCRKHGIRLLPPDVNHSQDRFSVDRTGDTPGIRFGLGAVKNVGHGAIAEIRREAQQGGPYTTIFDFARRVGGDSVNKRALECLIKAGALDTLPGNRTQKLAVYERIMDSAARARRSVLDGQISLFGGGELETPEAPMPDIQPPSRKQMLTMEKEVTGVYISGHPLDDYADKLAKMADDTRLFNDAEEDQRLALDGKRVRLAGIISDRRTKITRTGGQMGFVMLEDLYGTIEALVFPRVWERVQVYLEADKLVVLTGKISAREDEAPKLLLDGAAPLDGEGDARLNGDLMPYGEPSFNGDAMPYRDGALEGETPVYHDAPPYRDAPGHREVSQNRDTQPDRNAPLSAASPVKAQRRLFLKLEEHRLRDQVEPILKSIPGNARVFLHMAQEGKTYLAPRSWWVDPHADLGAVCQLLGAEQVKWVAEKTS